MNKINLYLQKLSYKKIVLTFLCLGIFIYANSLFNDFVGDDLNQIKNNLSVHSLSKIPNQFLQANSANIPRSKKLNSYKPIFATAISLIYFFSFGNPFGFHLIQILIHIANAILLFLIFKKFIAKVVSFLLSLLFITHPINTEAIVYISNLQEPLFLLFGLLALYLSIKGYKSLYFTALVTLLLVMSLLSKETGILFLLVIPTYSYLYKKDTILKTLLQSFSALVIYGFLRFAVAQNYFPQNPSVPIMNLPLWERIIHIPKIIFFYLKTFFYPKDLLIFQTWTVKTLSLADFYVPLFLDTVFFSLIIIFALVIYKKNKELFKALTFFSVWFVIGIGVHLQIIPLDQTVADRWFYFPIVGLLGIIGTFAKYLGLEKPLRLKFVIPIVLVIIIIFSVRVILRNAHWKDQLTLFTHDVKYNQNSHQLEMGLGLVYNLEGNTAEAEEHYLRAASLFPNINTFSVLGIFYLNNDRFEEAKKTSKEP